MNRMTNFLALGLLAFVSGSAVAEPPVETIAFKDPLGDDHGPGGYTYPTDAVYTPGSFDLTDFSVTKKGDRVTFDVAVNAPLQDPWGLGSGFSVQMVFIFIQTDNRQGNGFVETVPGLNVKFDESDAWDKLVILSPQPAVRVEREIEQKVAREQQSSIIVPDRAKAVGHIISASVDLAQLGGGDPTQWGYQVVIQSNEGYPENQDLLTRKVNEVAAQHRFGGGNDEDCDPHVIDLLAGKGTGAAEEVKAQHEMLQYACNPDGSTKKMAVLKMVRK
jgi:carbohydrate-binding DOMON domain-containing protein